MNSHIKLLLWQIFVIIIIGTAAEEVEEQECTIIAPAGRYVLANLQEPIPKYRYTVFKSNVIKDPTVDYLKVEHVLTVAEKDSNSEAAYIAAPTPSFNVSVDLPDYLSFRVEPIRGRIKYREPNVQYLNLHDTNRPSELYFSTVGLRGEPENHDYNINIIIVRAPEAGQTPPTENVTTYVESSYYYLLMTLVDKVPSTVGPNILYVEIPRKISEDPNLDYLKITAVSRVLPTTTRPDSNYLEVDLLERDATLRPLLFRIDSIAKKADQMDPNANYLKFPQRNSAIERANPVFIKIQLLPKTPGYKVGLNQEAIAQDLEKIPRTYEDEKKRSKRNLSSAPKHPELPKAEEVEQRRPKRTINSTSAHPELPHAEEEETRRTKRTVISDSRHRNLPNESSPINSKNIDGHIESMLDLRNLHVIYHFLLLTLQDKPPVSGAGGGPYFIGLHKNISDKFQYLQIEAMPTVARSRFTPGSIFLTVVIPERQLLFTIEPVTSYPKVRKSYSKFLRLPSSKNSGTILVIEPLEVVPHAGVESHDEAVVLDLENEHDAPITEALVQNLKKARDASNLTINRQILPVIPNLRTTQMYLLISLADELPDEIPDSVRFLPLLPETIDDRNISLVKIEMVPGVNQSNYDPIAVYLDVEIHNDAKEDSLIRRLHFTIRPVANKSEEDEHKTYLSTSHLKSKDGQAITVFARIETLEEAPHIEDDSRAIVLKLDELPDFSADEPVRAKRSINYASTHPELLQPQNRSFLSTKMSGGHIEATLDLENVHGSYQHLLVTLKKRSVISKTDSSQIFVIPRKHITDEFQFLRIEALPNEYSGIFEPGTINLTVKFPAQQLYFKIVPIRGYPALRNPHAKYLRWPPLADTDNKTILSVETLAAAPDPGFDLQDESIVLNLENGHDPSMITSTNSEHELVIPNLLTTEKYLLVSLTDKLPDAVTDNVRFLPLSSEIINDPNINLVKIEMVHDVNNSTYDPNSIYIEVEIHKDAKSDSPIRQTYFKIIPVSGKSEAEPYTKYIFIPRHKSKDGENTTVYARAETLASAPHIEGEGKAVVLRLDGLPDLPADEVNREKRSINSSSADTQLMNPLNTSLLTSKLIDGHLEATLDLENLQSSNQHILVTLKNGPAVSKTDSAQFFEIPRKYISDQFHYLSIEAVPHVDIGIFEPGSINLTVKFPGHQLYYKIMPIKGYPSPRNPHAKYLKWPPMADGDIKTILSVEKLEAAPDPEFDSHDEAIVLNLENGHDPSMITSPDSEKVFVISNLLTTQNYLLVSLTDKLPDAIPDNVRFLPLSSEIINDRNITLVKVQMVHDVNNSSYDPHSVYIEVEIQDSPIRQAYFKIMPVSEKSEADPYTKYIFMPHFESKHGNVTTIYARVETLATLPQIKDDGSAVVLKLDELPDFPEDPETYSTGDSENIQSIAPDPGLGSNDKNIVLNSENSHDPSLLTSTSEKALVIPKLLTTQKYLLISLAYKLPDDTSDSVRFFPLSSKIFKHGNVYVLKIEKLPGVDNSSYDPNAVYLNVEMHEDIKEGSPIRQFYFKMGLISEISDVDVFTVYILEPILTSEDGQPIPVYVRVETLSTEPHIELDGRTVLMKLDELQDFPEYYEPRAKRAMDLSSIHAKLPDHHNTSFLIPELIDGHLKATLDLENLQGSYEPLLVSVKNGPVVPDTANAKFFVIPRQHISEEFHYLRIEALRNVENLQFESGMIYLTVEFPGRQLLFKIVPITELPLLRNPHAKYLRWPSRADGDNKTILSVEQLEAAPVPGLDSHDETMLLNLKHGHDPSMLTPNSEKALVIPKLITTQKYLLISLAYKRPDNTSDSVRFFPLSSKIFKHVNVYVLKIEKLPGVDNSSYDANAVYLNVEMHDDIKEGSPIRQFYFKMGLISEISDVATFTVYILEPILTSKDGHPVPVYVRVETLSTVPHIELDGRTVLMKLDELQDFPEYYEPRAKRALDVSSIHPRLSDERETSLDLSSIHPELPDQHYTSFLIPKLIDGHLEATLDLENVQGSYERLLVSLKNGPVVPDTANAKFFVIPRQHISAEFHYLRIEAVHNMDNVRFEPGTINLTVKFPERQLFFKIVPITELPSLRNPHAKYLRWPPLADGDSKTILSVEKLEAAPHSGLDSHDEAMVLNLENGHDPSMVTPNSEKALIIPKLLTTQKYLLISLADKLSAAKRDSVRFFPVSSKIFDKNRNMYVLKIEKVPGVDNSSYDPNAVYLNVEMHKDISEGSPVKQYYFKMAPVSEISDADVFAVYILEPILKSKEGQANPVYVRVEILPTVPHIELGGRAVIMKLDDLPDFPQDQGPRAKRAMDLSLVQPELPDPHNTSLLTANLIDAHLEATLDLENLQGSYEHLLVSVKNGPVVSDTANAKFFVIPRQHISEEFHYLRIEALRNVENLQFESGMIYLTVEFPGRQLLFKIVPITELPLLRNPHAKYLRWPSRADGDNKTILSVEKLEAAPDPGLDWHDETMVLNLEHGHDPSMLTPNSEKALVIPKLLTTQKYLLVSLAYKLPDTKSDSVRFFPVSSKIFNNGNIYVLKIEKLPGVDNSSYDPNAVYLNVEMHDDIKEGSPIRQFYFKMGLISEISDVATFTVYILEPILTSADGQVVPVYVRVETLSTVPHIELDGRTVLMKLDELQDFPEYYEPRAKRALDVSSINPMLSGEREMSLDLSSRHPELPDQHYTSFLIPELIDGHLKATLDLENVQGSYERLLVSLKNGPVARNPANAKFFVIPRQHISAEFHYLSIEALPNVSNLRFEPGTIYLTVKFPGRQLYFKIVPIRELPLLRNPHAKYLRWPSLPDGDSKTILSVEKLEASPDPGQDSHDEAMVLNLENGHDPSMLTPNSERALVIPKLLTRQKYLLVSLAYKRPDDTSDSVQFFPVSSKIFNTGNVYVLEIEMLPGVDHSSYDPNAVYLNVEMHDSIKEGSPIRQFYFKMGLVSELSDADAYTVYILEPILTSADGQLVPVFVRVETLSTEPHIELDGRTVLMKLEELPALHEDEATNRAIRTIKPTSLQSSSPTPFLGYSKNAPLSAMSTAVKHRSLVMKMERQPPKADNVQFVAITSPLLKDPSVKYIKVVNIDAIDSKYYEAYAKFLKVGVPANGDPDAPLHPMYFKVVPIRGKLKRRQRNEQYLPLPVFIRLITASMLSLEVLPSILFFMVTFNNTRQEVVGVLLFIGLGVTIYNSLTLFLKYARIYWGVIIWLHLKVFNETEKNT